MRIYFSTIILLMFLTKGIGQEHYISHIDFNNTGQFAWQMEPSDDDFVLSIQTSCFDTLGSCGGLILVNENGNIKNDLLYQSFSGNSNSIIVFKDDIILTGEFNMGSSLAYSIVKTNKSLSHNSIQKTLTLDNSDYYNLVALSSRKLNEKIVFSGASTFKDINEQNSFLFELDSSLSVIKYKKFDFVDNGYSGAMDIYSTDDEIFVYFIYKEFSTQEDSIKIIRLDTAFNQTFEWSREVESNSIPRGCVTRDDNMIISVPEGIAGSKKNIYCIDTTGQTLWVWNWDVNEVVTTNILRIEEARNGDLFVMGEVAAPFLFNGDTRNTAFVMRLSSDGNLIWRRFLKIEDDYPLLVNYITDLVELDNGDLQLTGQSRRKVYDSQSPNDFRPDQDILWARIGGDGCINGDCSEVYLISNTNDFQTEKERVISIYPNPIVDGQLTIDVKGHSVKVALIYDLSGQLIMHQNLEYGNTSVSLEGNNSIFLIRIVDEEGRLVHSEKVIRI